MANELAHPFAQRRMAIREAGRLAICISLAGCATLGSLLPGSPAGVGAASQPGTRDSLGVTAQVVAAASATAAAQGFCVTSWHLGEGSADLYAVTPQAAVENVQCGGLPVFLLRPACMLTVREALSYPSSAPFVAIRCPYGASVWVTGFKGKS